MECLISGPFTCFPNFVLLNLFIYEAIFDLYLHVYGIHVFSKEKFSLCLFVFCFFLTSYLLPRTIKVLQNEVTLIGKNLLPREMSLLLF